MKTKPVTPVLPVTLSYMFRERELHPVDRNTPFEIAISEMGYDTAVLIPISDLGNWLKYGIEGCSDIFNALESISRIGIIGFHASEFAIAVDELLRSKDLFVVHSGYIYCNIGGKTRYFQG